MTQRPLPCVSESPLRNGVTAQNRKSPRYFVGGGEYFSSTTYLPQHMETFPERSTGASETIEGITEVVHELNQLVPLKFYKYIYILIIMKELVEPVSK
ncbi:hypothetical protein BDM02DRAFT_3117092 [Thelephora ganbajun]|uniref:Uncharacterized protein n=1 Tax=Thelephora ganbajun TaxID=370292 RepID=A0ACB6ZD03_THEGA|nr:hypothetical protein BDM02DRAFT_3117092 [Thelephora ganbajun]